MEVLDAQVHVWAPPSARYPWDPDFPRSVPPSVVQRFEEYSVRADELVRMMDETGIARAVLTSPGLYGGDHRYAFAAAASYPGRFGVVGPFTPDTPDVEERVRMYRDQPWGIGIRIIVYPGAAEDLDGRGYRKIFAAAEQAGVPVFFAAMGMLRELADVARRFSGLQMVLDHVGLAMVGKEVDRLAMLPDVLALAAYDNVAVKLSRVPELLSNEPYPFSDVWPTVHRVLDAFGLARVMWGSDITQHREVTYDEAVGFIRDSSELSASEKHLVLGGTARAILDWPIANEYQSRPDSSEFRDGREVG